MSKGIDLLRRAVNCFDYCNETFNQQFTAEELIKLFQHLDRHPELHDCFPDTWDDALIEKAIGADI